MIAFISQRSWFIIGIAFLLVFGRIGGASQASCKSSMVEWVLDHNEPAENLKTCYLNVTEAIDDNLSISSVIDRLTSGIDVNNRKGLRSLPTNLFDVFPDLEALKVSNCSVTSVNDKHFRSLSKLKYLNSESNEIVIISSDAFVNLISLKFLYLGHNRIPFLGKRTFASLKALKKLSVSFNEITFLNSQIFSPLVNVENLELWNN